MRLFTIFFCIHRILLWQKMTEILEQRICIKFCFKFEKSCVETIEIMKTAFEDECTSNTQIKDSINSSKMAAHLLMATYVLGGL